MNTDNKHKNILEQIVIADTRQIGELQAKNIELQQRIAELEQECADLADKGMSHLMAVHKLERERKEIAEKAILAIKNAVVEFPQATVVIRRMDEVGKHFLSQFEQTKTDKQ